MTAAALLLSLSLLGLAVAYVVTRERERRSRAEAQLDWVRSVVKGTNSSIWERDLETGEVTIVAAGPGILLGRSEESWRAETDRLARIHPDDVHIASTWVDRLRANGDHCEWELRVQSVDGSWHVLRHAAALICDERGRPVRACGLSIDITEQRLHEAGFTALFESTPLGVAMLDPEQRIITCNESFAAILGRPRNEIVDVRLGELGVPGPGETSETERCFLRGDGTPGWARLTVAQIEGVDELQLVILEDTSPRKQAELEREQATMRLQRLFDVTRIGMAVLGEGCVPLDVNDAFAAIVGRPAAELTATSFTAYTHPDDSPIETALLADIRAGARDHFELEKRCLRPDGEYVPVRLWASAVRRPDGSVENVIAMIEDVSDRKRAEAELSEKTALLERSQEVARIGSFTVDPVSGRAAWSSGIAEMFQVNNAAFGMRFEASWRFVHVDDRESVRRAYLGALAGDDAFSVQFRLVRLDGSHMSVVANGVVHRDEAGTPERVVGVILDVSERRELEEKLRQAEKLEAVGRLAGGVAHDFNNLLTVIVGHAESALGSEAGAGQSGGHLREILAASSRASELIRALLDFSRARKTSLQVVDLNEAVEGVRRMLPRLLEENITVVVEPSGTPARVLADRSRLEQTLLNLALNARDAMPDGGTLTVRTTVGGSGVRLTVSDTGEGMDERTRARVFEPFFTTKEQGRGTGLGLASVYGLVKQTGGTIAVESAPGAGTTFVIELPLSGDAEHAPVPIERALFRPQGGGERVLVVEDDPAVRSVTVGALRRAGYDVAAAENGESALLLIDAGAEFAVVVTDLMMPRMSGSQLVAELGQRGHAPAVIFTSGYPQAIDASFAGRGRVSFLDKPFTPRDLAAVVSAALGGSAPEIAARAIGAGG